jgi:hypothetical protein
VFSIFNEHFIPALIMRKGKVTFNRDLIDKRITISQTSGTIIPKGILTMGYAFLFIFQE